MLHIDDPKDGNVPDQSAPPGTTVPPPKAPSTPTLTVSPPSPSTLLNVPVAQALAPPKPPTPVPKPVSPPPPAPVPVASAPKPIPQPVRSPMNPITQTLSSLSLDTNAPPLSATPAAEAVKNLMETAKLAIGAPTADYTISLLPIQRQEASVNLFCSAVVVVVQHTSKLANGLGFHTLLLSDTAGQLQAEMVGIIGQQVEVLRVVGEAYDDGYKAVVAQALQKAFPAVPLDKMYDAEAETIPAGYNYKDVNQVQVTIAAALTAAGTLLNTNSEGFRDLSLIDGAQNLQSVAKLQFGQPQVTDSVGLPQRSDVTITYSEVTGQQRQQGGGIQSLNSGQRTTPLFKIGGFVDLVWHPVADVVTHNPYATAYGVPQGIQQMPNLYQPRFVITSVDAKALKTLPGTLLGLASVLTLRDNNNWMAAFRRSGDKDIHDIGAIGIEANPEKNPSGYGAPIDTRSANFTDVDQALLLRAFVRPDLAISLDVEECGPTTWLTSVFLAAAKGDNVANETILQAANLLTNGNFQQFFPANGRVVINDQSRIHLGHYTDSTGQIRDLRDIDHLCVLNTLGERDPKQARDWSDTFARTSYPMELRLQARRRIMDMISPTVTVTGYAQRVTFATDFLKALELAISATRLTIRSETPYQDMGVGARASADWLSAGALTGNPNSMFQRSFVTPTGGGSNTVGSFGRWANRG